MNLSRFSITYVSHWMLCKQVKHRNMSDAKNNKTDNRALDALIGLSQVAATEYLTANVVNNNDIRIKNVRVIQQDGIMYNNF